MVYNERLDSIKVHLKRKYKNNEKLEVAKALYNFGYLPDAAKYKIIYGNIINIINPNTVCDWTYNNVMNIIKNNILANEKSLLYKDVQKVVRLECYVLLLLLILLLNSSSSMKLKEEDWRKERYKPY